MESVVLPLALGLYYFFGKNAAREEQSDRHRIEAPSSARADADNPDKDKAQKNFSRDDLRGHDIDAHALIIGIDNYRAGVDSNQPANNSTLSVRARQSSTQLRKGSSSSAGVGKLQAIENLRGATTDAERMKNFLVRTHNVPVENIDMLMNDHATREGIIAAIKKLKQPENGIEDGSAIIIYYAGHGGRTNMIVPWDKQPQEVEVLVPYDAEMTRKNVKNVIPDYEIRQLLEDLSKAKGDNITVIFDCCHSAGLTRGRNNAEVDEGVSVRGIEFGAEAVLDTELHGKDRDKVLSYLESHHRETDETKTRGLPSKETIFGTHFGSYILLAACSQHQRAHEKAEGGFFTRALLDILESSEYKSASKTYTYDRIITLLGLQPSLTNRQTPYCAGKHKNRYLFSSGAELYYPLFFPVSPYDSQSPSTGEQRYELQGAGVLDVLTSGKFAVYPFPNVDALIKEGPTTKPLCILDTVHTNDGRCIAAISNNPPRIAASIPNPSIAIPVPRDLPVYVPKPADLPNEAQAGLLHVHKAIKMAWYGVHGIYDLAIKLVEQKKDAKFGFELSSDKITMVILDEEICNLARATEGLHIKTVSLKEANPKSFISIIRRAVSFFHRLRQAPETRTMGRRVEMDISQIKEGSSEEDDDDDDATADDTNNGDTRTKSRTNLVARSKTERQSDPLPLWEVLVAQSSPPSYGVELHDKRNPTSRIQGPIYPTLFFFDCHTLEICLLYGPLSAAQGGPGPSGKGDGALMLKESLKLNFGGGYGLPLKFQLDEARNTEAGYLRLFLTTSPIDLSRFSQRDISIDAEQEYDEPGDFRSLFREGPPPETAKWWDTITLPIRQIREKS